MGRFLQDSARYTLSLVARIRESWPYKLLRDISLLSWIKRIAFGSAGGGLTFLMNMSLHAAIIVALGAFSLTILWSIVNERPRHSFDPRPNLDVEAGIPTAVWMSGDVWTKSPAGRQLVCIPIKVSNVPRGDGEICAANNITGSIVVNGVGSRHSTLPWIGEKNGAVTIKPGGQKRLIVAVADYEHVGVIPYRHLWSFATWQKGNNPFHYESAGGIPDGTGLRLELTGGGKVIASFDLIWQWNDVAFSPIVTLLS